MVNSIVHFTSHGQKGKWHTEMDYTGVGLDRLNCTMINAAFHDH